MTIRTFATLLTFAISAHLLDALVTAVGFWRGIPEDNPIQLGLYHQAGLAGMDVVKLILVGIVVYLLWRLRRRFRPWQVWLAALFMAVPALLVAVLNSLTIRAW